MFKSFFKMELKKILFKKQLWIGFIFFMAVFIHISYINKADIPTHDQYPKILILESSNFFISYIDALGSGVNSYMPLIFPLIIMIIFGDSLFLDYNTSFFQFSLTRIDYKKYIKYKIISISLLSFIMAFLFNVCGFLYSVFTSPYHLPSDISFAPTSCTSLYLTHPYIYVFIVFIIGSLISMAISVSGIITANIFKNIFAVVTVPWFLLLLIGLLLMNTTNGSHFLYKNSPVQMIFAFLFDTNHSFLYVCLYWTMFWIIGALSAYRLSLRRFSQVST